jgi:hypothetical protein
MINCVQQIQYAFSLQDLVEHLMVDKVHNGKTIEKVLIPLESIIFAKMFDKCSIEHYFLNPLCPPFF